MRANQKWVDIFAGAGGSSTGISQAGGDVVWAGDNWLDALEIHRQNHPESVHVCQDLTQMDWNQLPDYDFLWASPSCRGHSEARGKEKEHHDTERATAWVILNCVEITKPKAIVVENVVKFRRWKLYPVWREAFRDLGYNVTENVLWSHSFGVPQSRERLFMVASREPLSITSPQERMIPAREIIRWDRGNWKLIESKGRSVATLKRVDRGRKQYGEKFLVAYYGAEKGGRSVDKPFGTITTKDRFGIINGEHMRMLSKDEVRDAMGFPKDYILPASKTDSVKMLGNAVPPPVARGVALQVMDAVGKMT